MRQAENHIGQRIVLTGGASQLTGLADFVSQYWKRRASLAVPHHIMGLDEHSANPAFSALVGMALQVARSANDDLNEFNPAIMSRTPFGRFGLWLRDPSVRKGHLNEDATPLISNPNLSHRLAPACVRSTCHFSWSANHKP